MKMVSMRVGDDDVSDVCQFGSDFFEAWFECMRYIDEQIVDEGCGIGPVFLSGRIREVDTCAEKRDLHRLVLRC